MPRAIASLSLSFGLVSIPVKLYSATETSSAIRFNLMRSDGARVRQQYVSDEPHDLSPVRKDLVGPARRVGQRPEKADLSAPQPSNVKPFTRHAQSAVEEEPDEAGPEVVERHSMVKGYEFEKGKFVLFTPDELKALAEGARQTIDIVAFIPVTSVDPIYYDKAYYLAPDKRGGLKPYSLLHEALRISGRSALAKWAWRSKQHVVQVRAAERGLVLQQLLYAEEVRSLSDLNIDLVPVQKPELQLALQLVEHSSLDSYDPTQFVDEEKQRILAAIEQKIAGREVVAPGEKAAGAENVIDLMAALRASLANLPRPHAVELAATSSKQAAASSRKPARRSEQAGPRTTARNVNRR